MFEDLKLVLKNRVANPVYGTFAIAWVALHWEFVFSIFLLDQDLIRKQTGMLKNEYLVSRFFDPCEWYFWFSWMAPFLITWLVIWKLPGWIFLPAFREEERFLFERRKIRLTHQKDLEILEKEAAQKSVERLEVVAEKAEKEKEIVNIDPTIGWENDYRDFLGTRYSEQFPLLIESIYNHDGYTAWGTQSMGDVSLSLELLAYAHSNGLVTRLGSSQIDLTAKGTFFVKRYSSDHPERLNRGYP